MASVVFPSKELLETSGYAAICHVPFIISSETHYLREPSRYLRERALLEWPPLEMDIGDRVAYPTVTTLRNSAEKLKNFLEWCEDGGFDWRYVEYTNHLILGYQRAMAQGTWSRDKTPLSPRTINQRVSEATLYLKWAADRGLRPAFYVAEGTSSRKVSTGNHTRSGQTIHVSSRIGRAPERPTSLAIPTPQAVGRWLGAVYTQRGYVKGLCAELIIATAIRLRECIEWRADTLPSNPAEWLVIGDKVQVDIQYGTKGRKAAPDSIIGPRRRISIPLALAQKLHAYRMGLRLVQHQRWIRAGTTKAEQRTRMQSAAPQRLFLGERSNRPFTPRMLRHAWSGVPLPVAGWCPHLGRHYWACTTLLDQLQRRVASLGKTLSDVPGDWITGMGQSELSILIRPQLGHLDEATSLLYLQWLRNAANCLFGPLDYLEFLET